MEENFNRTQNHNYDVAKFVGYQHLMDIRDIKNSQRNVTFQYVIVVIAILGLMKLNQIEICHFWIKVIIVGFTFFVIGSIVQFQRSLRDFRKRIYEIWSQPYFKHAIDSGFLSEDKKIPKKYTSLWYQCSFPLIYILFILFVMGFVLALI